MENTEKGTTARERPFHYFGYCLAGSRFQCRQFSRPIRSFPRQQPDGFAMQVAGQRINIAERSHRLGRDDLRSETAQVADVAAVDAYSFQLEFAAHQIQEGSAAAPPFNQMQVNVRAADCQRNSGQARSGTNIQDRVDCRSDFAKECCIRERVSQHFLPTFQRGR